MKYGAPTAAAPQSRDRGQRTPGTRPGFHRLSYTPGSCDRTFAVIDEASWCHTRRLDQIMEGPFLCLLALGSSPRTGACTLWSAKLVRPLVCSRQPASHRLSYSQRDLAQQLAELPTDAPLEVQWRNCWLKLLIGSAARMTVCRWQVLLRYFEAFILTMQREWFGIDKHRLDKFLMLVRVFLKQQFCWLSSGPRCVSLCYDTGGSALEPDLQDEQRHAVYRVSCHFGHTCICNLKRLLRIGIGAAGLSPAASAGQELRLTAGSRCC